MTDLELFEIATAASECAYAPYSGYRVGAALLCGDGRVYTGANVENSSYGASICAERTAALRAVIDGYRSFEAIAVSAPETGASAWPCGICRQFLFEFGGGLRIVTGADSDNLVCVSLDEILAHGFRLEKKNDE